MFGMHETSDATGRLVIEADTINSHFRYNSRTMANDIAIIGEY